jgi:hypothetical protein
MKQITFLNIAIAHSFMKNTVYKSNMASFIKGLSFVIYLHATKKKTAIFSAWELFAVFRACL